jgi:hypothetical protein
VKFLCIRNYFEDSSSRARWTKGKYYEGRMANGFDKENGITCYVVSNSYGTYNDIEYFVKTKEYNSYFKSIEDVREEKLNQILDVGNSNDDLVSGNTRTSI